MMVYTSSTALEDLGAFLPVIYNVNIPFIVNKFTIFIGFIVAVYILGILRLYAYYSYSPKFKTLRIARLDIS